MISGLIGKILGRFPGDYTKAVNKKIIAGGGIGDLGVDDIFGFRGNSPQLSVKELIDSKTKGGLLGNAPSMLQEGIGKLGLLNNAEDLIQSGAGKFGVLNNAEDLIQSGAGKFGILNNAKNLIQNGAGSLGLLNNAPAMVQYSPIVNAIEEMGGIASLSDKNTRDLMDMQRDTFSRFLQEPGAVSYINNMGEVTLPPSAMLNIEPSETYGQIPLMGIPTLGLSPLGMNPLGIDIGNLGDMDFSQLGRG